MQAVNKSKAFFFLLLLLLPDAPAGEDARQLVHVALCVTGVHPQGVQLHQLSRVILIDTAHVALCLVQKIQHGRVACAGQ